jgi:hypothetical protein
MCDHHEPITIKENTMARKPTVTELPEHIVTDADTPDLPALAEASRELHIRSVAVSQQYGDGQPYDRHRYIDKCRYHMTRSAEEALEVGRALLVMKEHEPHGEWLRILDDLGVASRLAQRMMQAAIKFSNASTSTHLLEAAKSKSKLFELMVLDDEDLEALAEGGTVAGLQLDDVDRMSVSELRAAIRQARKRYGEDMEIKDKQIAAKNLKLDELDAELTKLRGKQAEPRPKLIQPWKDEVADLNREQNTLTVIALDAITKLKQFHLALIHLQLSDPAAPEDDARRLLVLTLVDNVNRTVSELGLLQQSVYEEYHDYLNAPRYEMVDVQVPGAEPADSE